jgi:ketosteroid isomerase-like protein
MPPGPHTLRARSTLAVLVLAATLAACGESADERAVRETVEDVRTALRDTDVGALCGLYSEAALMEITGQAGGPASLQCQFGTALIAPELAEQVEGSFEVTDVTIDGDTATVTTESENGEQTAELVREDGRWKIDVPAGLEDDRDGPAGPAGPLT